MVLNYVFSFIFGTQPPTQRAASDKPYIVEGCKSMLSLILYMGFTYLLRRLPASVQPRLEIHELQKNPKQFSLFIRAFWNIMQHDYKFEGSDAVNWQELGS